MTGESEEPLSFDAVLQAARVAIASGDALAAVDLLQGLAAESHTLASRQLWLLALLRSGGLSEAAVHARQLLAEGHQDEETLGLAAREAKARWLLNEAGALAEARDAYLKAFRATRGTWTGINAATLTLVAGDEAAALRLADEVDELLRTVPAAEQGGFWHLATMADVALIRGQPDEAASLYAQAIKSAPRAFGDFRSARDNALVILAARGQSSAALKGVFPGIGVAAFSGHTIDTGDREAPRFPASAEATVAAQIKEAIAKHGVEIGISAAACGADILFLEALQAQGKETHIILPHPAEDFRRISVTDKAGEAWGRRFDEVMRKADMVTVLSSYPGEDLAYQFQGSVIAGSALLRAEAVGGHALGLALWDGKAGGVGGTATVIQEWAEHGLEVQLLGMGEEPAGLLTPSRARALRQERNLRRGAGQRVVSILFADAVGFSKLGEMQVKSFVREFWGRVAALLKAAPAGQVLTANTWGDGLFLIIDTAPGAAEIALSLAELVNGTDWGRFGLPSNTNIRIALHAGPAYEIDDPIIGQPGFSGVHISRAARIEPVTPPGTVYVSDAFAALLAFDDSAGRYGCEYVGTVPLAKHYGRLRTFRLARRS